MQLSDAGLNLIKRSEGLRLEAYNDIRGIPTIGYGHRIIPPATFPGGITEQMADRILADDVQVAEQEVSRVVKVSLTQGQFDALVDFTFNLGAGRLDGSTLLKMLDAQRYREAGEQLLLWDHAGLVEVEALKARRRAEYAMWVGQTPGYTPTTQKTVAA